jgi:hypothetical protein
MQKIHVLALAAITALAFPSLASATTVVTIAGDPNAAISNFQNPGNTATSPYTITTSDNGTQVVVALTTTDLGALDFANLYFETVASDVSMGSNLGFEASGSAVNDAFFPDTGQKFSTALAGFSSSETFTATSKTITVTIPNSFFLTDPDGIGFPPTPDGTDVSLHLSQSFGYSVVGGSADFPRPQELGLATVSSASPVPEPAGLEYMVISGLAALVGTGRRFYGRLRA